MIIIVIIITTTKTMTTEMELLSNTMNYFSIITSRFDENKIMFIITEGLMKPSKFT